MTKTTRKDKRIQRKKRIRAKIAGNATKPRLVVFRSNKHLYAQLIDDEKGQVLAASSDVKIKSEQKRTNIAKEVAKNIAEKAKEQKIGNIVFDRGGYKYHGQVKVLAQELRKQGIAF
ncbi:MAG: 50S ribosomal protein L18 [Patescibacteria group bacterium]